MVDETILKKRVLPISRWTRVRSDSVKKGCDQGRSTLRLSGLKAGACSGLTLSGASLPRLERRGLAPPNGSNPRQKDEAKLQEVNHVWKKDQAI
jgi:hypothetical protein